MGARNPKHGSLAAAVAMLFDAARCFSAQMLASSVWSTEVVCEIPLTTPAAPTEASKRQAIFDRYTETDARRKSKDLGFGVVATCTERHRPNRLRSCRDYALRDVPQPDPGHAVGGCVGPSVVMGSTEHRHGFDFDLQAGDGQFGDADGGGGREGLDEELLPHLSKSS